MDADLIKCKMLLKFLVPIHPEVMPMLLPPVSLRKRRDHR